MCKPKIDFPLTYAYSLLRMYKYNIYRFFNPLYILSSLLGTPTRIYQLHIEEISAKQ